MESIKGEWRKAISAYYAVKTVYIQSEELDDSLASNVQPLNQLRDALDHFIRVISVQEGFDDMGFSLMGLPSDFAIDNLKSATSHLYRAFFDACDSVSISYREGIRNNVSGFSKEAIMTAIPSYYSEIRPRVNSINEEIANLRRLKGQNPNSREQNIEHYLAILGELQKYYRLTSKAEVSLIELKEEESKRASAVARSKHLSMAIQIATPILCSVLGFVLGKLF